MYKAPAILTTLWLMLLIGNSVAADTFPLESSHGGTLYLVNSDVSAESSRFLIDTGSSLTILNQTTFKALKSQQSVQESGLAVAKLANGRKQKVTLYTIPILRLSAQCYFENVSVAVMQNPHNILGMGVLSRAAPIGIELSPPRLTLSQCDLTSLPMHQPT